MKKVIDLMPRLKSVTKEGRADIGLCEQLRETLGNPEHQESLETTWVRSIVERYSEIVSRNCPEFDEYEWRSLLAVFCDPVLNVTDSLDFNWEYLANHAESDLGFELLVDPKELAGKIRRMSYEQQCAIVEVATLFWARKKDEDDYMDLLRQVGGKIKY